MKTTLQTYRREAMFAIVFFFLAFALSASAQGPNNPRPPAIPPEAQRLEDASGTPALSDKVASRTEKQAERREALEAKVQDRIVNLAANVTNRLKAAIGRLENVVGRLETRIEKLKDLDVDTEAAEAKLGEAKDALETAQGNIDDLDSVRDAISGDNPREMYKSVREQLVGSVSIIRQAFGYLRETVALLKEAVRAAGVGSGVSEAVRMGEGNASSTGTEKEKEDKDENGTTTDEDTSDNNE